LEPVSTSVNALLLTCKEKNMKNFEFVVLFLVLGVISFASADYVNFLGQPDGSGGRYAGVGAIDMAANWEGGAVPYGSDTGLITQANNVWTGGVMRNAAVRLEGGQLKAPNGLAMRGGMTSGITTLLEIDTTDWQSVINLDVPAGKALTFWSQDGQEMVLNVINGSVEASAFNASSSGKGTINLGNGIVHAGSASGTANYNMLAGGSGDIVFDAVSAGGFGLFLNFETGNTGSFTLGSRDGGTTAGVWDWFRNNGMISIDGVVTTDPAAYVITQDGLASTITLVPEPATMMILGLGSLLLRRKR
jgi:hypothetical protein